MFSDKNASRGWIVDVGVWRRAGSSNSQLNILTRPMDSKNQRRRLRKEIVVCIIMFRGGSRDRGGMPQIAATEDNLWIGGMGVKSERSCLRALVIWYHHVSGIVTSRRRQT